MANYCTCSAFARRLLLLAGLSLSYAGVCLAPWLRARARRRAAAAARAALAGNPAWLVAYASQTGNAEELATQTAHSLQLAGVAVAGKGAVGCHDLIHARSGAAENQGKIRFSAGGES